MQILTTLLQDSKTGIYISILQVRRLRLRKAGSAQGNSLSPLHCPSHCLAVTPHEYGPWVGLSSTGRSYGSQEACDSAQKALAA